MGFIVPPPNGIQMRVGQTVVDLTQYTEQYGWLCLYCHTVQSAHRGECCNCGASKPGIEEAAVWVADQFAARLGIKHP